MTVRVGSTEDGCYVEDNGPGIPEDERERVVEAGYSTAADGTGYVLSIVGTIADAHGWEFALSTGEEGGSRFEFTGMDADNDTAKK